MDYFPPFFRKLVVHSPMTTEKDPSSAGISKGVMIKLAAETIAFLFILLFIYAALAKLTDYEKFRAQLGQSPLLTAFAGWVAWGVPAIEIVIASMLAMPRLRLLAFYAAFSLMVMFTAYIVVILQFSDYVPCSCGGVLQDMSWTQHLIFNIVFVLLAVTGILLYSQKKHREAVIA
jgi:uncharacterized membrane protein YphA (DoxX/SURF4 family)